MTLLQLLPGPGGMENTLSDLQGRASLNAHLLDVSCLFPKPIPPQGCTMVVQDEYMGLVYSWAETQQLLNCHGQRVAEGQTFLQDLVIDVRFIPLNLRET